MVRQVKQAEVYSKRQYAPAGFLMKRRSPMRRPVKYLVYITASVLVLAVFFAFGLPAILRAVLASQLTKNLHRPASVESVSFNPFKLCLTVQGLAIREPDNSHRFCLL